MRQVMQQQPRVLALVALLLIGPVHAPAQSAHPTSDEEVAKASEVTRAHPSDSAWSRLGDAYMQKARETMDVSYYGLAEALYKKSLAVNPNYANALVGMARERPPRVRTKHRVGK
jgi:hypothetical protein